MRVLTVLPKLPGDPVDGHVVRTRPFLKRLIQRAEVDIIAYDVGSIDEEIERGAASCQRIPTRLIRNSSVAYRLRHFFSPEDVQQRDAEVTEAIEEALKARDYDLVWVAGWRMLLYLPTIQEHKSPKTRVVADVIDDEVRGNWQDLREAKGVRSNAVMGRRLVRNSLYQRRFLSEVDLALFVAEADADTTRARLPKLRVEVNQNGVDTEFFSPQGPDGAHTCDDPVLLFEGTMSYAPNIEGVKCLVREVLPRVQAEIPGARALLVGRNPTDEVLALAADDVEVTGTVSDIRAHMRRGALLACSLRTGTGLKNKILQSWSLGIPVVATPISIPGLGATHGENLLVAEDMDAFAGECVRLLKSKDLRSKIGRGGRDIAVSRYSIEIKLDEIDRFIDELAQGTPKGDR